MLWQQKLPLRHCKRYPYPAVFPRHFGWIKFNPTRPPYFQFGTFATFPKTNSSLPLKNQAQVALGNRKYILTVPMFAKNNWAIPIGCMGLVCLPTCSVIYIINLYGKRGQIYHSLLRSHFQNDHFLELTFCESGWKNVGNMILRWPKTVENCAWSPQINHLGVAGLSTRTFAKHRLFYTNRTEILEFDAQVSKHHSVARSNLPSSHDPPLTLEFLFSAGHISPPP